MEINDCQLRRIMMDFMTVSTLLNSDLSRSKMDPYAFQEIFISLCYRLLHLYPLSGQRPSNEVDNAYYLGLLALLTTFLFQHGPRRLPYHLLAAKLRSVVTLKAEGTALTDTGLLWLLLVGGISVFGDEDKICILSRTKACFSSLNIDSWESALKEITKYPWINAVHSKAGQTLWKEILWS